MSKWIKTTLAKIADIRVSNVDKKSYQGEKPVMLCNYMDVYSNDYITRDISFMEATANIMEIAKFTVSKGDVLITKDSETPFDIGIPAVVIDEMDNLVCGYHLAQIKPDERKVDSVFLAKLLSMPEVYSYFSSMAAGSTRYSLSKMAIANTIIPLPHLEEQKKISDILQVIDKSIEKTERLVEKYQKIKTGMTHDLFTRGIDREGKLRPLYSKSPDLYRKTKLGWLPKEWDIIPCSHLCSRITVGIVIQPTKYYVEEGIPAFRSANIREDGLKPHKLVYISSSANSLLSTSQIKTGDILSVRTGYPGTSAVVPEEFNGCNCIDILISSPKDSIDTNYLCFWINSSFGKEQVLRLQGGMAQQHFNVGDMRQLLVAVPSIDEQKIISDKLMACSLRVKKEKEILNKLIKIKSGLMHELLNGKVKVRLEETIMESNNV